MICKKPFIRSNTITPFGCGQCLPCRIKHRRTWAHRITLESFLHSSNCFVTLTYKDLELPATLDGLMTLDKADVQKFIKKLRKKVNPKKIRYFYCGEYGDKTQRPHYHLALYGLGMEHTGLITDTWDKGHVMVGDLTIDSANYIAKYVTKKMTNPNNRQVEEWLHGRSPEFAHMSLKPGIGAGTIKKIARDTYGLLPDGEVPRILKHGRKNLPLGRYLRTLLTRELGLDEESEKSKNIKNYSKEMSELYQSLKDHPKIGKKDHSFQNMLQEKNTQKIREIETRYQIHNNGGNL